MHIAHSHVLLDACCVVNLYASRHLHDILRAVPAHVAVTQVVYERELVTLRGLEDEEAGASPFETAIAEGLLRIVDFESEAETDTFVNNVAVLGDDGESATCAIAVHRRWAIATDDKRAISFARQEAPTLQVVSTLEVVKHWSERAGLDAAALREALTAIRVVGRYVPHRGHPLRAWWEAASRAPST